MYQIHIKNISKGLWGRALSNLAIKRKQIIKTVGTYIEKKELHNLIEFNLNRKLHKKLSRQV